MASSSERRDPRRVLVLDGDQPAALAVTRSLGRRGLTVDIGERRSGSLCAHSRYSSDTLIYPDPLVDASAFVEAMAARVARVHYDLVIPVTEDTVQPLAAERARFEPATGLAIAPSAALEVMTDKVRTLALAVELGVPVPKSATFTTLAALEAAAPTLTYPVVLKPARSIASEARARGSRVKLTVLYAHDPEALIRLARHPLERGPVLVQEYFRGDGVGVEVLADHGEVVYAFQHRRLHELPLTGGGSCLRESVPVHPGLLAHAKALMRAVAWHGVAMVEFKHDPATDACRLMEVNGRFWGSLPLAVAAGADFPAMLVDLLTERRRPSAPPAKTGIVARKLSQDVYWYVQVLRPDQDEPLIRWPTRREAFRDLALTLSPRHHFDVQSLDDPRPGLVDGLRTSAWFAERALSIVRRRAARRAAEKVRASGAARARLAGAKNLLFVCYGNINRSALAEAALRAELGDAAKAVTIRSAGFHEEAGRSADPIMVAVAHRARIDLSPARSSVVDRAGIEAADLVFGMELAHLERLRALAPEARDKLFLLSAVTDDPEVPLEIADPYGQDEAAYARCFDSVTRATRAMAGVLFGERRTVERRGARV